MGLFDNFPYTNFHELNLDWILKVLKDIETTINQFVSLNIIKYADPIQWDITRQYAKNTIVIDPVSGTAYISVDNVPQGVALSNTDYWSVVFDLGRFITLASQNFAVSYEPVLTTTATMPTAEGGWIVWNSLLYEALNDIHIGDRYVEDGNIKKTPVEVFFNRLKAELNTEVLNRQAADNALGGRIDQEILDRGAADVGLGARIDQEILDRESADRTLQGNIDAEAQARQDAINTEANTRNQADSQLDNRITQIANSLSNVIATREYNWYNRKFLFCGDSYGDEEGEWPSLLISNLNLTGRAYNLCVGGAGFVSSGSPYLFIEQIQNFVSAHPDELGSITDIVVCGGLNDSFSYDISTYAAVQSAMDNFNTYVKSVMPYAKISLGYIGNGNDTRQGTLISGRIYECRQVCRYIYYNQASKLGWNILHNVEYLLTGSPANIGADGVHPTVFGSYELALGIGQALINGAADYNYPSYDAQPAPTIGQLSGGYLNYKIHNNVAEISGGSLTITVNQGTVFQGGVSTVIMNLNGMYFNNPVNVFVNCILYNASVGGSGTNYVSIKGRLTFNENKVYLAIYEADGTGYKDVTYSTAGTLTIIDFDKTFDSMILV